jgi:hypothetical protein
MDTPLLIVSCGGARMRVEHGVVCAWRVKCDAVQHFGGYHAAVFSQNLMGRLGAAVVLRSACTPAAVTCRAAEVERGERGRLLTAEAGRYQMVSPCRYTLCL